VTGEYLAMATQPGTRWAGPSVVHHEPQGSHMEKLTGENVGRKMASCSTRSHQRRSSSQDRRARRITMGGYGDPFKLQQEVKDLVAVLRSGALPAH